MAGMFELYKNVADGDGGDAALKGGSEGWSRNPQAPVLEVDGENTP